MDSNELKKLMEAITSDPELEKSLRSLLGTEKNTHKGYIGKEAKSRLCVALYGEEERYYMFRKEVGRVRYETSIFDLIGQLVDMATNNYGFSGAAFFKANRTTYVPPEKSAVYEKLYCAITNLCADCIEEHPEYWEINRG